MAFINWMTLPSPRSFWVKVYKCSISRRRRLAISASWRMRLESLLPTVEVTRNAKSATQFCGSATVKVPTGGRKKKLKERIAASDIRTDTVIPQTAETAKIASRKESATVVWFRSEERRVGK